METQHGGSPWNKPILDPDADPGGGNVVNQATVGAMGERQARGHAKSQPVCRPLAGLPGEDGPMQHPGNLTCIA